MNHPYRTPPETIVLYKHGLEQKASRIVWALCVLFKGRFRTRVHRCRFCNKIYFRYRSFHWETFFSKSKHIQAMYDHQHTCGKYKTALGVLHQPGYTIKQEVRSSSTITFKPKPKQYQSMFSGGFPSPEPPAFRIKRTTSREHNLYRHDDVK